MLLTLQGYRRNPNRWRCKERGLFAAGGVPQITAADPGGETAINGIHRLLHEIYLLANKGENIAVRVGGDLAPTNHGEVL